MLGSDFSKAVIQKTLLNGWSRPIRDPEYFSYSVMPTPIRHLSEFFLKSKPGLCPIDFSEGSTMDSGRYSYLK